MSDPKKTYPAVAPQEPFVCVAYIPGQVGGVVQEAVEPRLIKKATVMAKDADTAKSKFTATLNLDEGERDWAIIKVRSF